MHRIVLTALIAAVGFSAAHAQTSARDLEVLGRALGFLEGVSGSERLVAIVYDPAAASEAEALTAALSGGMSAGRITMNGRLVPLGDTAGLAGAHAALLVGGARADSGFAQAASSQGVMTVSTDLGCVQAGRCVMGVQSAPAVRILVNRAAAGSASVSFSTAFAMMVEEI